jgi:hypothetical protein
MAAKPPGRAEVDLKQEDQLSIEEKASSLDSEAAAVDMLSQAVNDRYRCPDKFFNLIRGEQLSSEAGYFHFGPNAICYGRSCSETQEPQPEFAQYDAMRDVTIDDTRLCLPFNPTEIIDNLRLERYANGPKAENRLREVLRNLYYLLRPLTNLTMRKQVQKFHARDWEKKSFPRWPVDTTVESICETVLLLTMKARGVEKIPFVWFWPNGASGCLTMTHDVETKAGRDHCAELMNVDDSFRIKATFGIVPEERYEVPRSLLDAMRIRGFEIAVQDLNHDGRLFDNKEQFLRRAKIINRYGREFDAKGFRAAVLYRKPEWYDALEFAFDMSIPNVAHLDPQHGGCCTVMPFWIGDVLELPVTTTQDYTLFHVLNERSIDLWKSQIDLILGKNGLMSFIVHPDYIMDQDTLSVYKELLGHLQELRSKTHIWCALPSEIDTWWRARHKMSVVKDGRSWRIEGEGAERAVLAYAKNVDGELVYELSDGQQAQ